MPDKIVRWLTHTKNHDTAIPSPLLKAQRAGALLRVRLLTDGAAGKYMLLLDEEQADEPMRTSEALGLSQREAEVLGWVAAGKTNADIAALCNMNIRTVQKHLERIYTKLGVETRTAAARRALEAFGWIH